ncbi:hypothetical protein LLG95_16135 [bacterium]|nr:hypothetical protein [bacterium]
MTEILSKSKIDQLGERLKRGASSEADLILLDDYRQSFGEAYEQVLRTVAIILHERKMGTAPTGRAAKSTESIIAKLRRESIRLSQMQDIAGCRVVVQDVIEQDKLVKLFSGLIFVDKTVIDRRDKPSHGYRAVHVIARMLGKPVEIQIRTRLQHLWAELSEKFSDIDPNIKYGGGDKKIQYILSMVCQLVEGVEIEEKEEYSISEEDEKKRTVFEIEKKKTGLVAILEETIKGLSRFDTRKGQTR